jgi:hypothetical protein
MRSMRSMRSLGISKDFKSSYMTPLSYQGFGFTAILLMVGILSAVQLVKYLKERFQEHAKDRL